MKVSFIGNYAELKGGAIYATSLIDCLWSEKPPHLDYSSSLRWSDKFLYSGNRINSYSRGPSTGRTVDIATGTVRFEIAGESKSWKVNTSKRTEIYVDWLMNGSEILPHPGVTQ